MKIPALCALFVLLAVSHLLAAVPLATGSITGRIQNSATGQSLNNARVTVKGTDLVAFTDETGSYRLTNVPAGLATLDLYRDEGLFERAAALEPYWQEAVHSLKGRPHVIDIRNIGLMAGIEMESRPGKAGARGSEVFLRCFDDGVLLRFTGDTIALSPPLIIEKPQIDRIVETLSRAIQATA